MLAGGLNRGGWGDGTGSGVYLPDPRNPLSLFGIRLDNLASDCVMHPDGRLPRNRLYRVRYEASPTFQESTSFRARPRLQVAIRMEVLRQVRQQT